MGEYSPEDRKRILAIVIDGLRKGTPLTVICSADGMPCDDTIRNWADADPEIARDIARARDTGFDVIAMDALRIADETSNDTKVLDNGQAAPNSEWITRSRLRVETRLKLLAKWDPKRYGDKQLIGSDPENPLPQGLQVAFVREVSKDEG